MISHKVGLAHQIRFSSVSSRITNSFPSLGINTPNISNCLIGVDQNEQRRSVHPIECDIEKITSALYAEDIKRDGLNEKDKRFLLKTFDRDQRDSILMSVKSIVASSSERKMELINSPSHSSENGTITTNRQNLHYSLYRDYFHQNTFNVAEVRHEMILRALMSDENYEFDHSDTVKKAPFLFALNVKGA
jgi:hypothetical protein